jgi:transposase
MVGAKCNLLCVDGCTWRNLPGDFPAWQTVYTYFRNWRRDGTWVTIHEKLRDWVRSGALRSGSPTMKVRQDSEQERKPDPLDAIVDSQSVKTAAMLNQSVGYDAGNKIKGRKRAAAFGGKLLPKSCLFVTVDTLGLVLSVFVTAASQDELIISVDTSVDLVLQVGHSD